MTTTSTAYDVAAVRADFPALRAGAAHFDGPGGSQVPRQVAEAVAATLTAPIANRGRLTEAERTADAVVVAARAAVGDLVGGDPGGVVFGRSMTQLTYDLSRTLAAGWGPGDEVVVTRLDHDANVRPWVQAAAARGATVRWADLDPATGELTPEALAAVLSERTRLVAVTGASNLIGTRPDVPALTALAHEAGALAYVDGVHLTAHAPVDVAALGADLYACSPYKFLGPHLGCVVAAPSLLETLHPDKLLPSTDAVPERFELGTLPYELLAGTTAAVDYLAALGGSDGDRRARLVAGMAAVEAHEDRLRERVEEGVAELPGVTLWSRAAHRTPTLLLTWADRPAAEVSRALAGRGVNAPAGSFYAIEASRALGLGDAGGLRVGLAPYSDDDDVDRLLEGLRAAA
jgi:cysteine desulfurase family protein (TIGR01976 family)